ncbi:MAG: ribonuclease HII [candidate division Zixibacteria bacterium]|nr:ribonuclease HII [candidate division Zixibacteria bacterium]MDH3938041.1 ribonuclease HII [candidate division Zixibacteria bacterium]MDH4033867.1 ribonuclease HII [candidate division Zixibacteria bacterium]
MKIAFDDLHGNFDFTQMESMLVGKGYESICGVDEVGRGPLAGPVVAAAVIIPCGDAVAGIDDSKRLSAHRRDELFDQIVERGWPCAVGVIDSESIDSINILQASLMAMRKAIMDINPTPDFVLVDGKFDIPNIPQPQCAIIGGDRRCRAIAAASIVAKVTRDRIMDRYQVLYPSFSFAQHKGYPTPVHLNELKQHGPSEIHRRTFKPVADLVSEYVLF